MRVLVACEESQTVCRAFRAGGHDAFSCDVVPATGGHPEWHLQQDVVPLLGQGWDMVIAFPPCTHLAASGARHFAKKAADGRQQEAIDLFMAIAMADVRRVAIENPVGIMSSVWRPPDQIVQPWQFGDAYQKTTCLWLRNLPQLRPTNIVDRGEFSVFPSGKRHPKWYAGTGVPRKDRQALRSRTFPGIAAAMAEQWGQVCDLPSQSPLPMGPIPPRRFSRIS